MPLKRFFYIKVLNRVWLIERAVREDGKVLGESDFQFIEATWPLGQSIVSFTYWRGKIREKISPENTLGEITIASGAPFVYCFNNSEVPIDQTHELAMALFGPNEDVHYGGVTKQQNFCSNMDEVQHIISAITEPKEMDKESRFFCFKNILSIIIHTKNSTHPTTISTIFYIKH
jgi:hypothetical protein